MKAHFDQVALDAQQLKSDGDVRLHLVSSVRLLLQQAVFGLLEWACKQPPKDNTYLPADLFAGLLAPSDGTLIDSLESLIIYCEQLGWNGVSRALSSPIPDEAACKVICGDSDATTAGLLRGLVQLRNEGAEGHGLVGGYQRDAELDCLQQITSHLGSVVSDRFDS
ncbi:MAG: hypothetical protein M3461_06490 [Pseudomonadota bacterium]|nr:hypothetical protein [Pseudomonadota bacterium]